MSDGVSTPTLLVATTNPGKLSEFRRLLPARIRVLSLGDRPDVALPAETGETFQANATAKAMAAAQQCGHLVLADDSGLEVDALGGAPGVLSARYAGEPASDERNRGALLAALMATPPDLRGARFRCVVALARPDGVLAVAEGVCEGRIATEPRGSGGFGYDPIFLLDDGRTMAELTPAEKDRTSHRSRAYGAILARLLAELEAPSDAGAKG